VSPEQDRGAKNGDREEMGEGGKDEKRKDKGGRGERGGEVFIERKKG